MKFKKIVLRKNDNNHIVQYQDERGIVYKEIDENDFNALLEKLKFNNDFALPDRLVQDFINDGSIMPSFKRSIFFNKSDMEDIVKNIRPYRKKRKYPRLKTKKKRKKRSRFVSKSSKRI